MFILSRTHATIQDEAFALKRSAKFPPSSKLQSFSTMQFKWKVSLNSRFKNSEIIPNDTVQPIILSPGTK